MAQQSRCEVIHWEARLQTSKKENSIIKPGRTMDLWQLWGIAGEDCACFVTVLCLTINHCNLYQVTLGILRLVNRQFIYQRISDVCTTAVYNFQYLSGDPISLLTDFGCVRGEDKEDFMRLGDDDIACWTSDNLTTKRDSDWRKTMRARREARMVSACSPCTNIRSALISVSYSEVWKADKTKGHDDNQKPHLCDAVTRYRFIFEN